MYFIVFDRFLTIMFSFFPQVATKNSIPGIRTCAKIRSCQRR